MAAMAAAAAPLAPPGGGVLGGQQGGAVDGGAGAARAARRNGRPHVRVRLVRINLRSLLQLAVLGVILYQVRGAVLGTFPGIGQLMADQVGVG